MSIWVNLNDKNRSSQFVKFVLIAFHNAYNLWILALQIDSITLSVENKYEFAIILWIWMWQSHCYFYIYFYIATLLIFAIILLTSIFNESSNIKIMISTFYGTVMTFLFAPTLRELVSFYSHKKSITNTNDTYTLDNLPLTFWKKYINQ